MKIIINNEESNICIDDVIILNIRCENINIWGNSDVFSCIGSVEHRSIPLPNGESVCLTVCDSSVMPEIASVYERFRSLKLLEIHTEEFDFEIVC